MDSVLLEKMSKMYSVLFEEMMFICDVPSEYISTGVSQKQKAIEILRLCDNDYLLQKKICDYFHHDIPIQNKSAKENIVIGKMVKKQCESCGATEFKGKVCIYCETEYL